MEIDVVEESHEKFPCELCGKSYPRKSNLGAHKWREHNIRSRIILPSKTFSCPVCAKVVRGSSRKALTQHMMTHEAAVPIKCDQCGGGFKNSASLQRHKRKIHEGNRQKVKCELCSREFASTWVLEKHVIAAHVVDKEFHCSICNSSFIEAADLLSHMRDKHQKRWKCDMCPKYFLRPASLQTHLLKIHAGRELCTLCLKFFPSRETYQEHLEEAESRSVVCPDPACKLAFGTQCLADQHWSQVHQPKIGSSITVDDSIENKDNSNRVVIRIKKERKDQIVCDFCEESFTNYQDLGSHRRRVHPNKELKCEVCQKTFSQRSSYTRHVQGSHGAEPKYKCEICSKLFQTPASLSKHFKSHDADKPHKCSQCPKSYVEQRQLRHHLASSHGEGEKPYKCPHCPKRFFLKSDLENSHIPSHFEARPFACDNCQKRYKTKASLHKHKRLWCSFNKKTQDSSESQELKFIPNIFEVLVKEEGLEAP